MTIRLVVIAATTAVCIGFSMPAAFATPGDITGAILPNQSEIKKAKSVNADDRLHAGFWSYFGGLICIGTGGTYLEPFIRDVEGTLTPRPGGDQCVY